MFLMTSYTVDDILPWNTHLPYINDIKIMDKKIILIVVLDDIVSSCGNW